MLMKVNTRVSRDETYNAVLAMGQISTQAITARFGLGQG